jgi:hypothetical protein
LLGSFLVLNPKKKERVHCVPLLWRDVKAWPLKIFRDRGMGRAESVGRREMGLLHVVGSRIDPTSR